MSSARGPCWVALVILIAVMGLTYRSPSNVLGRLFIPDGIEYAVGAQRLATDGVYAIRVDRVDHPPRYPPGYSCLIAPAYWLSDDLTAGVWISRLLWSAGCAVLGFAIASRISAAAAFVTVALIHVEPTTARLTSTIMADAPAAGAMLALIGLVILPGGIGLLRLVACGLVAAVAIACRPLCGLYALALLPVAWRAQRIRGVLALAIPCALVVVAGLIYQRLTFGSFGMNGYVYWQPLPYARIDYVFHPANVVVQLGAIARAPMFYGFILAGLAAGTALAVASRPLRRDVVMPILLLALPITLVHLFYFFIQARLFLPILVASTALVGIAIGAWLSRTRTAQALASIIALAAVGYSIHAATGNVNPAAEARVRLIAEMRDRLPEACRVITFLEPPLFDAAVARGTKRRWIAASRDQEYANKLIAKSLIDLAALQRPPPLRIPWDELKRRGAVPAVMRTAQDESLLEELRQESAAGLLFVDVASLNSVPGLRGKLEARFRLASVSGSMLLMRCDPR